NFGNSRYGFRVQSVVARDYTVSAWYYTAFNQAPVPRIDSTALPPTSSSSCQLDPTTGRCRPLLAVELVHKLVPVVGVSNTFFFQPLNGIIRMEAEYFNHEPGFIPQRNLLIPQIDTMPTLVTLACKTPQGNPAQCGSRFAAGPPQFAKVGQVPHADFL